MSCWPVSSAERKSTPFKAALVATATYPGYVNNNVQLVIFAVFNRGDEKQNICCTYSINYTMGLRILTMNYEHKIHCNEKKLKCK